MIYIDPTKAGSHGRSSNMQLLLNTLILEFNFELNTTAQNHCIIEIALCVSALSHEVVGFSLKAPCTVCTLLSLFKFHST